MNMPDDASSNELKAGGSADELADRLQAIDEQVASVPTASTVTDGDDPEGQGSQSDQLERVKDMFQLINRLRTRDSDLDRDPSLNPTTRGFPQAGFRIGNYVVEDEIARGGMGIVFQARDLKLNRCVALKILRAGPLAREEDRIRFLGEAEAAARLDHPAIVPVYEVGDQDGVLYFTMGIIEGPSLSDLVRRSPLEPTRAAAIAKTMAEAADYAHQRGIIHRDLKPSNVLFDNGDRVRVADFGLARRIDGGSDLTMTGQVVGTPEYMAPEQAAGNASSAGPSADIYSIGATLYCMLTGQPPFRSSSAAQTLRWVMEQDPISLRKINRSVPADLETICMRCLEKQPSKRYPTAASLADDLSRFLLGEPIEARRPGLPERALRWSRRHPLAASLVGALLFLAILGPIVATSQMRLAKEAQTARDTMARTLYISDMNLAMRDWDGANLQHCGELLKRHIPQKGQHDLRGFEWHYLWRNWQHSQTVPVVFQDDQLETIALAPDNQTLAAGCFDGRLILWNLREGRIIREWQAHPYRTYRLQFANDGRRLASASIDNEVAIWDRADGTLLRRFSGSRAISFSPVDDSFAYRTQGRRINIHPTLDDEPVAVIDADPEHVEVVCHSPDGLRLASAGWDGQVKLWDSGSGEMLTSLPGGQPTTWSLSWCPSEPLLAGGDTVGTIRLWNTDSNELLSAYTGHNAPINSIAFSPDAELLVSASSDNTVAIRSLLSGQLRRKLKLHSAEVKSVVFADHGNALLTASTDGTVKKWSLDGRQGNDLLEHPALVNSVTFSPDGTKVATACYDGKIRCWNVADGTLDHEFVAHQKCAWRVVWIECQGRGLLITSGQDGAVRIWDAESRELVRQFDAKPNSTDPLPIAVSPDQHRIAFPIDPHQSVVWDLKHDRQITKLVSGKVEDIVYSPDGRNLLGCSGNLLLMWDANTGKELSHWAGGSRFITRLQYAPDGRTVAATTYDHLVKIWNTESLLDFGSEQLTPQNVLTGSAGVLSAVDYSDDGAILATAGDDKVIRLWDTATGQQRAALSGHDGAVFDVAFSPNGQVLASASADHSVRIWRGNPTRQDGQVASE